MSRPKPIPPAAGDVVTVPHPFLHDAFEGTPCWKPGTADEQAGTMQLGNVRASIRQRVADAWGQQILTVQGVYRPGKFPTRVFFTRQWKDPGDLVGEIFGFLMLAGVLLWVVSELRIWH